MAWIVRLVSIGAAGEEHSTDVMRIAKPDTLADLGTLGLSLAEGKQLLVGVQQELVAAQARLHAARRPACRSCCSTICRVKDYRQHAIATLFGQVAIRLPRYCCVGYGVTEAGLGWPLYIRSTDGRLAIRYKGVELAYRTFDKLRQVSQAEIVENKRLGAVLAVIREQQIARAEPRSKKAPRRRDQSDARLFKVG